MNELFDYNFYARHFLKIITKSNGIQPLKLRKYQLEFINFIKKIDGPKRIIVLKPRQAGFSTICASYFSHRFLTTEFFSGIAMADKHGRTQEIAKIYTTFINELNPALKPMIKTFNTDKIWFANPDLKTMNDNPGLQSGIQFETANDPNAGRSGTRKFAHLSEAAFYRYANEIDEGIQNSIPLESDTFIIKESTANGKAGIGKPFYDLWIQAKTNESLYKPFFVAWYEVDDYFIKPSDTLKLTKEEKELMKEIPQINEGNILWRRLKMMEYQNSSEYDSFSILSPEERFNRDFPSNDVIAFHSTGAPIFDPMVLERKIKTLTESPRANIKEKVNVKTNIIAMFFDRLNIYSPPRQGRQYFVGCLPDGEIVLTDSGHKKINEVLIDDQLVSENGDYTKIKNIQRKFYRGDIFTIQPHCTTLATKFTGEHPILVLKDNKIHREKTGLKKRYYRKDVVFKKMRDVTENDILRFPIRFKEEISQTQILKKISNQKSVRFDFRLDPAVILLEDFWFFMGTWLANGWIRNEGKHLTQKTIEVCFNAKNANLSDKIKRIINNLFDRNFIERIRNNSREIRFNCKTLYQFIANNFGQKAGGKYISEWIKFLPLKLKLKLFEGYFSCDGCIVKSKNKIVISCVSISQRLLIDFQDILLSADIMSSVSVLREESVHIIAGRQYKTKKTYTLTLPSRSTSDLLKKIDRENEDINKFSRSRHKSYSWIDDNFLYLKIAKIKKEKFNGYVNNFETESHSYCSNLITTHNCDVSEGLAQGDNSTICVIDEEFNQVCTWVGKIDPDLLGHLLIDVAIFYNRALLVPEVNNMGHTTLTTIKNEGYSKLFQDQITDKYQDKESPSLGWRTTEKSKNKMLNDLLKLFREDQINIFDKSFLLEMTQVTRSENGKVNLNGKDRTVSLCLAVQGRLSAKNIKLGLVSSGQLNKSVYGSGQDLIKLINSKKSDNIYE